MECCSRPRGGRQPCRERARRSPRSGRRSPRLAQPMQIIGIQSGPRRGLCVRCGADCNSEARNWKSSTVSVAPGSAVDVTIMRAPTFGGTGTCVAMLR